MKTIRSEGIIEPVRESLGKRISCWNIPYVKDDALPDIGEKVQIEISDVAAPTRKELLEALKNLLFAYQNKDGDMPHMFELDAVEVARVILEGEELRNE